MDHNELPLTFINLDEEDFPLTMRAYREDTNEQVWEQTLEEPGTLSIPALAKEYGVPITTEVEYPDGTIVRTKSTGESREVQSWWQAIP